MNKKIIQYFCVVAMVLLMTESKAQQTLSFTLKEAIKQALENNITLQQAKIDEQIAHKKVDETVAIGLPNISAGLSYTNNVQIPVQVLPNFINAALPPGSPKGPEYIQAQFGQANSITAKATLNQLLLDGTYFLGLKAAKDFVLLSTLQKDATEKNIVINTAKAYYMVLLGQTQLRLFQTNYANLDSTFKNTKAYYEQGLVEKIDVSRLEVSLTNIELQKLRAEDQVKQAENMLKLMMGLNTKIDIQLTESLDNYAENIQILDVSNNGNMNNRVEFKLLQQSNKLNELSVKRYKMGYLPSLSGFLIHQQNSFSSAGDSKKLFNTFYPGTLWGLNLNIPIFQGFGQNARITQAKLNLEKSELQSKQFELNYDNEVTTAQNNYIRAYKSFLQQQRNVELAMEVEKLSKIKLNEGISSSLEYVTAQTEATNAKTNQTISLYELLVGELEYKNVTGQKPLDY